MSVESLLASKPKPCCNCIVNWQLSWKETIGSLFPIIGLFVSGAKCIKVNDHYEDLGAKKRNYKFSRELSYQNAPEELLEEDVIDYQSLKEQKQKASIRRTNLICMFTINFAISCAGIVLLNHYFWHLDPSAAPD